jgi:sigma-B regulation protein RsbU (phosphoserine phosphatase)
LTDGITESQGPDGTYYGVDRVLDVVKRHHRETARHILDTLFEDLGAFVNEGPQLDDLTAVICKLGAAR